MTETLDQNAARIIRKAAGYVRQGWTQGANARDAKGRELPATDDEAVEWCASGALHRACEDEPMNLKSVRSHLLVAVSRSIAVSGFEFISAWNDNHMRTANQVAEELDKVAANLDGS